MGDEGMKKRTDNRWTKQEDEILFERVTASGPLICWGKVAEALPGRNNKACRKRWIHSLDPKLRKGRWSPAEDAALIAAVKIHGDLWYQVARTLKNGRTDDQCAKRWREALDPNIRKDRWTSEEDQLLMDTFAKCGRKWNEISKTLNGRPPVQCRNRFMSLHRPDKDDVSDVNQWTSPFSAFSPSLDLEDYESSSVASSRRSSLSSNSSLIPSTPAYTSLFIPNPSYPSSDLRFHPTDNWQTSQTEIFPSLSPISPQYKSFENNSEHLGRSCANSWDEYQLCENFEHSISREPPVMELGYPASPSSPLEMLRDASVAAIGSGIGRSVSSIGSYSTTAIQSPNPEYNTYNAVQIEQANPFLMTCPVPNCAFYCQSLTEIWRHITWEHVCQCMGVGIRDEDVLAIERFVLGSSS